MKKRIIYLLMATIGTVGFTGCGPGHNTTEDRTGTYSSPTGTQMGTQTTQDRTVTTTGNQTATTGTSGTRTTTSSTTTTGTAGTTSGNTGQRAATANNEATGAGTTQATQISGQTPTADTNVGQTLRYFKLNAASDYSYNNQNFRFTPDQRGISITRDQNGTHTPFGTLRSFGNDGYYMVTTSNASGQEETSVGRFDEKGNFTVYRYDRNGDKVIEQNYRSNTPMNQNNR